jgi:DNA topoisomerase I
MTKKLVIVESPAKARTISGYLGDDYIVESSIGHVRDLPRRAADVPAKYKGEKWANLGVDVENDFHPLYIVPADKKKHVTKLKKLLSGADALYLATDEDREGESIAWHLLEVLKPKVEVKRMVFHEITKSAILEAAENPRELDRRLVDAQETRRILDRLIGYEVSPVLWRKVKQGLSAGRVQSPATRIIVERERERIAFISAGYWGIDGVFAVDGQEFEAALSTIDEQRIATGRDFGEDGKLASDQRTLLDEKSANTLAGEIPATDITVTSVEAKPFTRRPYPPFRTSTLQQEGGRKLRFGARRTMSAAQSLYEAGFITYMRTDSTQLSDTAIGAARRLVGGRYGDEYLPEKPRVFASKVKSAQEAHEAIRPAGDSFQDPAIVAKQFGPESDQARLYDLIWKRTVASQMKDAKGEGLQVRLGGTSPDSGKTVSFAASGQTLLFAGFLRAYVEGADDPEAALDDQEKHLPNMTPGQNLDVVRVEASGHETRPPARYTEASLIKRLEELGIGRPSTYASIISTIQDRGYAFKKGSALVPTFVAFSTVALLEQHFEEFVDYAFTANMESDLDSIAGGQEDQLSYLNRFYFGNGHRGLKEMVALNLDEIDAREINSILIGADENGEVIVARAGRYGPYVQRGEETASLPDEIAPDEVDVAKAVELLEAPDQDRVLGDDPKTGLPITVKNGRYGPYVQVGEREEGSKVKPPTASLFKSMSIESVTLDDALLLLQQPRTVGAHPEDGADVIATNGRYGPYLKWGKETRSLETEDQIFGITMDEAVKLLAEPKRRGGRKAAAPLKELGDDPNSKKPVVVKDGRFGPYVTDGEVNASLRVGDSVETITIERAAELLQMRRDKGPVKKKAKSTAKKPAAKKKASTKESAATKKAAAKK